MFYKIDKLKDGPKDFSKFLDNNDFNLKFSTGFNTDSDTNEADNLSDLISLLYSNDDI